ncbi:RNA-binding S4 domain-containing protein [candidate division KSB1 bacterium]|nr:RNA-binding S4 domain-containing protein [candidate division KSB1 bacterium]
METQPAEKMRLDKWLKIARIFKSRSLAAEACDEGKVMVNNQIAKAAKTIQAGDTLVVRMKQKRRTFDILDISTKSISAEKARLLYHEHEPTPEEIEEEALRKAMFSATNKFKPKYKGRPTKKEGRTLRNFRGH